MNNTVSASKDSNTPGSHMQVKPFGVASTAAQSTQLQKAQPPVPAPLSPGFLWGFCRYSSQSPLRVPGVSHLALSIL